MSDFVPSIFIFVYILSYCAEKPTYPEMYSTHKILSLYENVAKNQLHVQCYLS